MENFLTSSRNRLLLLVGIVGFILIAGGVFLYKSSLNFSGTKVEVLSSQDSGETHRTLTAEISGEIMSPGVYKLPDGSRIDDLLLVAGGFSEKADRVWSDKYLNRAAKITDGQKVYIPSLDSARDKQSDSLSAKTNGGDQSVSSTFSSDSNALININLASLSQLDSLPGIGQVYGQSIIEHRPYSTTEELVSKGAIKQSLYNKVKDKVTVY